MTVTNADQATEARPRLRGGRRADTTRAELPTPVRHQRRWGLIALGIALLAVSVLGVQMLVSRAAQTAEVLALTQDVERGEQIQGSDLSTVRVPIDQNDLATVDASMIEDVIGQVAAADLIAGTTLTPTATVADLLPPTGQSVVGFALTVGQLPAQPLRAGDHVRIVDTPVAQGDPPAGEPTAFDAVVLSVQPDSTTGTTLVDLQVDAEEASEIAVRAFTGRAALVLDTPGG